MKQIFLSAILAVIGTMSINAADDGVVAMFVNDHFGLAMDADGTTYPVYYQAWGDNGEDLVFYFLNEDFSKGEQVVFKGYGYLDWTVRDTGYYLRDFGLGNTSLNSDNGYLFLTRGIFESENKKDWVIAIESENEDSYEHKLVNSSGKILTRYSDDDGTTNPYGYHINWMVMPWYGKMVGAIRTYETCHIVDYSSDTNAVKAVIANTSRAYPNPLPKDTALTVELETPVSGDGRLMVVDMRGRTVFSTSVKAGDSTISVPAGKMRQGEYIYTITDGRSIVDHGRIIAQ